MKKNKIIAIILIIIIAIAISIIGTKKAPQDDWERYYERSNNEVNQEPQEEQKEITIYDIEDGYMKVPYNAEATKNEYNWEEYLQNQDGHYKYEDEKYKSKLGIDVSSHQKNIDWKKVKEDGVEFAILRIGYRGYGESGKIVIDSSFEQNYKKAREQGIEIGVYFFSQAISIDEVKEEADFVMKNLQGKEIAYPVVYDLERIKNDTARTDNLTEDEITNMMLEFCKIIEQNGYTPCIYGNAKTFTTKTKLEQFNSYQKWYADYQEKPIYPYEFNIWQYTETGKINGITGNVDIDIQFIKKAEIEEKAEE